MIDLYYWTTPNGHKITIFLEATVSRPALTDRKFADSPVEGTGFEPSVSLFERVLSALPNRDAGPIGWMGS